MTSAGIIAICGILTFIASRSSYDLWKVLAGVAWSGLLAWWIKTPIGGDATSPEQTIMLLLSLFAAVACFFWAFWVKQMKNGVESGGKWRLPFMQSEEDEELSAQQRRLPTRTERTTAYRNRLNAALRGERRRR